MSTIRHKMPLLLAVLLAGGLAVFSPATAQASHFGSHGGGSGYNQRGNYGNGNGGRSGGGFSHGGNFGRGSGNGYNQARNYGHGNRSGEFNHGGDFRGYRESRDDRRGWGGHDFNDGRHDDFEHRWDRDRWDHHHRYWDQGGYSNNGYYPAYSAPAYAMPVYSMPGYSGYPAYGNPGTSLSYDTPLGGGAQLNATVSLP